MSFFKDHDSLVNPLIFPAPTPPTYSHGDYENELIWLPSLARRDGTAASPAGAPAPTLTKPFPCLLIKTSHAKKVLIYLHGNAEDIGLQYELMQVYAAFWNVHVLAVEYPAYGPLRHSKYATESGLNRHARVAYEFLAYELKVPPEKIIVCGRSIGSGPALHLTSQLAQSGTHVGAVMLQAAFLSVKTLARSLVGGWASLMLNRFNNEAEMSHCACPVFVVHGRNDELIPIDHAESLYARCAHSRKMIHISETADHNQWDFEEDIVKPTSLFLATYMPDEPFAEDLILDTDPTHLALEDKYRKESEEQLESMIAQRSASDEPGFMLKLFSKLAGGR